MVGGLCSCVSGAWHRISAALQTPATPHDKGHNRITGTFVAHTSWLGASTSISNSPIKSFVGLLKHATTLHPRLQDDGLAGARVNLLFSAITGGKEMMSHACTLMCGSTCADCGALGLGCGSADSRSAQRRPHDAGHGSPGCSHVLLLVCISPVYCLHVRLSHLMLGSCIYKPSEYSCSRAANAFLAFLFTLPSSACSSKANCLSCCSLHLFKALACLRSVH